MSFVITLFISLPAAFTALSGGECSVAMLQSHKVNALVEYRALTVEADTQT